jgi:hypothetical protein
MTRIGQRHIPGQPIFDVLQSIAHSKYGVGLNHLPSGRFGANAAWLALNIMAHNMSRWVVRIAQLDIVPASDTTAHVPAAADSCDPTGENPPPRRRARRRPGERKTFLATDTLRRRYLAIPARLARSARKLTVHLPARWPWAQRFNTMLAAIRAVEQVT